MNILIPMAGRGSRFVEAGYELPKPLIDVGGKPMIEKVIRNISLMGTYIFLVQKEHCEQYGLRELLYDLCPRCIVITVDEVTEGAACTCLLARDYIDTDEPLIIANCDQIMNWDVKTFSRFIGNEEVDGCILTFHSTSNKNSYVRLDSKGHVTEVAEKKVISDMATCGFYYWRRGDTFVWSADKMICQNNRVNNEFYVCPTYQYMIDIGYQIYALSVRAHYPIGTPEDLEHYKEITCLTEASPE